MKTIGLIIRLMIRLPQVWIALVAIGAAIVVNGQEPFVDIATYAIQRLF
jgi:hypothetical protein